MLGPGKAMVLNDLYLWDMSEVPLESRRVEFGSNDNEIIRGEDSLRVSLFKVEEVVEAENAAAANITANNLEAVDITCLSRKTPGLIQRGIDGQEHTD